MNDKNVDYEVQYFWDIETSKVEVDQEEQEPLQVVYLGNVLGYNLVTGEEVCSIFHRHIGEVIDIFNSLSNKDKEIIVYCHNLDYELFHLLRETGANGIIDNEKYDLYGQEMSTSILRDKNSPLSIKLDILPYVTFKDSYALFNKSVKQLGKDLEKRGIQLNKLDYDYEKVRIWWDKLEQHDYDYNKRDNEIVAISLYNWINDNQCDIDNIPLTFTSSTKRARKKYIESKYKKNAIYRLNKDKQSVINMYDFYKLQLMVYQGGLTTALPKMINRAVNVAYSVDIKSSYPSQMCRRHFPVYFNDNTFYIEGEECNDFYHDFLHNKTSKELRGIEGVSIHGYMGVVSISKLKIKSDDYLLPLSLEHCIYSEGVEKVNGKVRSADIIVIPVNDVDMDWLLKCYNYQDLYMNEMYLTNKSRQLAESETSFILKCFDDKENIDKEKYALEYALSKVHINAQYGIKVQKPIKDRYTILNGEINVTDFNKLDDANLNIGVTREEVYKNYIDKEKENFYRGGKNGGNFDIFSDGIYITSYARLQIVEMMIKLVDSGYLPIYTDTDSLKFTTNKKSVSDCQSQHTISRINNIATNENIQQLIEDVNIQIINENKRNIRFISYKEDNNVPKENYDKICKLGIWEIESEIKGKVVPYTFFKTLGAKKYCYIHDNEIHTTIAGCSKKVNEYITKYADINNIDRAEALNEIFDTGTQFDSSSSGRTISIREKRPRELCRSFTYKGRCLESSGGIVIEKTTYLLNVSTDDSVILDNVEHEDDIVRTLNSEGVLTYE